MELHKFQRLLVQIITLTVQRRRGGPELLSSLLKVTALGQSQDSPTYPSSDISEMCNIVPLLWTQHNRHSTVCSHDDSFCVNTVKLVTVQRSLGTRGPVPHTKSLQAAVSFLIPPVSKALSTGFGPPICQVCYVSLGKLFPPLWTSVSWVIEQISWVKCPAGRSPIMSNY